MRTPDNRASRDKEERRRGARPSSTNRFRLLPAKRERTGLRHRPLASRSHPRRTRAEHTARVTAVECPSAASPRVLDRARPSTRESGRASSSHSLTRLQKGVWVSRPAFRVQILSSRELSFDTPQGSEPLGFRGRSAEVTVPGGANSIRRKITRGKRPVPGETEFAAPHTSPTRLRT
jgi:hypothetical protein